VSAPDLSIVVCTHDRAALLDGLLGSLAAQSDAGERWDVWIVDSASSDATPERARAWSAEHPRIHAVREAEPGLARARNRGWHESRGRWLAYVDDDARLPAGWVANALRVIDERAPDVFGGPYRPFYLTPKPGWYRDDYQAMDRGSEPRALGEREYLSGTNLVVRRAVLDRVRGFDAALGMTGGRMAYGEETDLQDRIRREIGPAATFWYDPALEVEHLVAPEKMSLGWAVRTHWARGRDWRRLRRGDSPRGRVARRARALALAPVHAAALLVRVPWVLLFRDRRRHPDPRNGLWELSQRHVQALGALWADARDPHRPTEPA
jgi:glycosyltransferase involved in cell wall biosynthesis